MPMNLLEDVFENQNIGILARNLTRSPFQSNKLHESDAELIALNKSTSDYLAITIDTVAEEISEGLYRDPFTMGWVTVMASLSDLAAVGAEPIGVVTAVSLEPSRDRTFRRLLAHGLEEACRKSGTFILGGDLNTTHSLSLTGCAIGTVPRKNKLARIGCERGDIIFLSGKAGSGNALGMARKANFPENTFPEKAYRPIARIKEGQLLREYATSCMDTSDGLFITIDQLIRLNNLGFSIHVDWENILRPDVYRLCTDMTIPYWFMAAGIHGEFELLFTVPSKRVPCFLKKAHETDFWPITLGKIIKTPRFEITTKSEKKTVIDMTPLRNLWDSATGEISDIIQQHHFWGNKWGLN